MTGPAARRATVSSVAPEAASSVVHRPGGRSNARPATRCLAAAEQSRAHGEPQETIGCTGTGTRRSESRPSRSRPERPRRLAHVWSPCCPGATVRASTGTIWARARLYHRRLRRISIRCRTRVRPPSLPLCTPHRSGRLWRFGRRVEVACEADWKLDREVGWPSSLDKRSAVSDPSVRSR
jgi:hypothetical protein